MSVSWPSARITVSAASVSNRPVGCGKPDSSSSITSTCSCGALERLDRAQPVDPHALPLGVLRLLLVRRHLLARAAVDDQRLLRAQPPRRPRRVHRRVAAAVDRHATPDHRPLARGDAAQERHRVHDRPRVPRGDLHALGQVRADGDEHRVEAALAALGLEIGDPVVAGEPHAQRRDPLDLAAQHVAGHPVGRDAVAHHPAGLRARVADLDLVAEPRQVVGGRRARSGRRRSPARACRCARAADRTATRARAPGRRGTARPRGSRPRCRGWRGCSRSRTGGSRRARGSPRTGCPPRAPATPARARPPARAQATPGCSPPPGTPALHGGSRSTYTGRSLANRPRARATVHQIRQRRDVPRRTAHVAVPPRRARSDR